MDNEYRLMAVNIQGAGVTYYDSTINGVLNKFDSDYSRKGWKIEIIGLRDISAIGADQTRYIKTTFR